MVLRDHFLRYGSYAQIFQILQGQQESQAQQNPQAQANCGLTVLLFLKSSSYLRLTLLIDTGDMLKDFKTCHTFMLQEYSILQIILSCT